MFDLEYTISSLYTNLFMISIARKYDFEEIVSETEEEVTKLLTMHKGSFLPTGYEGVYFIEKAARLMGSSLGEVYGFCQERKEELLQKIIEEVGNTLENWNYESEDEIIEFTGIFAAQRISDENEIFQLFWKRLHEADKRSDSLYIYYPISLYKDTNDETYSIVIENPSYKPVKSDYVYEVYEVWAGDSGFFADFIENLISLHEERKALDKQAELAESDTEIIRRLTNNKAISESDKTSKVDVVKPIIETLEPKDGEEVADELIRRIDADTKTIDLLDLFEGFGPNNKRKYRRLVIENGKYHIPYKSRIVWLNLVIERGQGTDYVGDITFTNFKKSKDLDLQKYVRSNITDQIIEKYLDKDIFFRFSKPFLLRAQNSSNRTGYGWEWDWSGGYGDYTEGTLYGETTNYFFVGAYISSGLYYYNNRRI